MEKRFYYVLSDKTGELKRVETTKTHLTLGDCYGAIKCDWVEDVTFTVNKFKYHMILDEEGKINGLQVPNYKATALYNKVYDSIWGTVVIAKTEAWATFKAEQAEKFEKDIFDTYGMTVKEDK